MRTLTVVPGGLNTSVLVVVPLLAETTMLMKKNAAWRGMITRANEWFVPARQIPGLDKLPT
jgi:nitrogen fixation protein